MKDLSLIEPAPHELHHLSPTAPCDGVLRTCRRLAKTRVQSNIQRQGIFRDAPRNPNRVFERNVNVPSRVIACPLLALPQFTEAKKKNGLAPANTSLWRSRRLPNSLRAAARGTRPRDRGGMYRVHALPSHSGTLIAAAGVNYSSRAWSKYFKT
jgi:hypothetical protein